MILSESNCSDSRHEAWRHHLANPTPVPSAGGRAARFLFKILLVATALGTLGCGPLFAGTLYLPNGSFESPVVPPVAPYAAPDMDYWQNRPSLAGITRPTTSTPRGRI